MANFYVEPADVGKAIVTLAEGQFVTLMGHRQAGKTTLLNALARRLPDITSTHQRFFGKRIYPLRITFGPATPLDQARNVPGFRCTAAVCLVPWSSLPQPQIRVLLCNCCMYTNRCGVPQGVSGFWRWMLERLKLKDRGSILVVHDKEQPTAADFCAAFRGSNRPPVVLLVDRASALAREVQNSVGHL